MTKIKPKFWIKWCYFFYINIQYIYLISVFVYLNIHLYLYQYMMFIWYELKNIFLLNNGGTLDQNIWNGITKPSKVTHSTWIFNYLSLLLTTYIFLIFLLFVAWPIIFTDCNHGSINFSALSMLKVYEFVISYSRDYVTEKDIWLPFTQNKRIWPLLHKDIWFASVSVWRLFIFEVWITVYRLLFSNYIEVLIVMNNYNKSTSILYGLIILLLCHWLIGFLQKTYMVDIWNYVYVVLRTNSWAWYQNELRRPHGKPSVHNLSRCGRGRGRGAAAYHWASRVAMLGFESLNPFPPPHPHPHKPPFLNPPSPQKQKTEKKKPFSFIL